MASIASRGEGGVSNATVSKTPPSPFAAARLFPLPLKGAREIGPAPMTRIEEMSVRLGIEFCLNKRDHFLGSDVVNFLISSDISPLKRAKLITNLLLENLSVRMIVGAPVA